MDLSRSRKMLTRVASRLRLTAAGRSAYRTFVILCALYALLLLVSRLLGLIPDWFGPLSLVGVPVLAVLWGIALHRRATAAEAAETVDRSCGTKDLFLTAALLEEAPGEFKPLVARAAEERAPEIQPGQVVPFVWAKRLVTASVLLGVLFAGSRFLPQFDPFGQVAAAESSQTARRKLADSRTAAKKRIAQIKREQDRDVKAKEVKKAVTALKTAFNTMKPKRKKQNRIRLSQRQKKLAAQWRALRMKRLKDLMAHKPLSQQFGASNQQTLQKWTRQLQQGNMSGLRKEIASLQQDLQRLAKTKDPLERAKQRQKLRKRLQTLKQFASKRLNSKPLSAALARALDQLAMSKTNGLSSEALQGLSESLDLTQLELEQLAQSARDLKNLEEALKALQLAKQLNGLKPLDGKQCKSCNSLGDYQKLYAQLISQCQGGGKQPGGNGNGNGLGGPGHGRGGKAPEDDSVASKFKTERSRSAITAGKILLSLKTRGMGANVESRAKYRSAIKQVRQGVSEAVLQEQIPPGYLDGIKNYFDRIDSPARKSSPKP